MISSLELAKLCGVSQGTVDRALHNRKGISRKTQEKILAKAAEYAYMPNPAAREIITGKSKTVVALIPSLQSPFFMDMMAAIKNRLNEDGLRLLISTINDLEEMILLLNEFATRKYLAAIIIPPTEKILIPEHISKMKIISLLVPCIGENTFYITPDEVKLGEKATQLIIDKGHRNIAHIIPKRRSLPIRNRLRGYKNVMRQNELIPFIEDAGEEASILSLVREKGITAFFCHNDWIALSIIRILENNRISVPNDVSIMGVDNSYTFTSLYPDITTIEYPLSWLADEVANTIKGNHNTKMFADFKIIKRRTL
ncbi:MAG: LacI family DNA-binding transcriptional regulator [Verrucomicrobiota bacterium]|nr:LacI family DNA-binding transcriptional regulator [Verrucomicrobiota bacterium]